MDLLSDEVALAAQEARVPGIKLKPTTFKNVGKLQAARGGRCTRPP